MSAQENLCGSGMNLGGPSELNQICLVPYQIRGKEVALDNGHRAYLASPGCLAPAKLGIVLVYDNFSFDITNTRRFADMLADQANAHVIMPDFFSVNNDQQPKNCEEANESSTETLKWDVVSPVLSASNSYLRSLLAEESCQSLGIVGFSWGGKQVLHACSHTDHLGYLAGVSIHGVSLGPEDAQDLNVPIFLMLSGEDPSVEPLKTILYKKPFGDRCRYYTFSEEGHGFAAARGDLNNQATLEAVNQAIALTAAFLEENVLVSRAPSSMSVATTISPVTVTATAAVSESPSA